MRLGFWISYRNEIKIGCCFVFVCAPDERVHSVDLNFRCLFPHKVCRSQSYLFPFSMLSHWEWLSRSTASSLRRMAERPEYHTQHSVKRKNGGFRLMTSPFCVRVSLLFLSITITGEVLITLPHFCASPLWQILTLRESGCAKAYKLTKCVYKWGEVLLLLLRISHTQDLIISLSRVEAEFSCTEGNAFPTLYPVISLITTIIWKAYLLEQLFMWECGKTVLTIGVETLMQSWGNTEGWQSAVADVNVL